jgi:hypothetical protein
VIDTGGSETKMDEVLFFFLGNYSLIGETFKYLHSIKYCRCQIWKFSISIVLTSVNFRATSRSKTEYPTIEILRELEKKKSLL